MLLTNKQMLDERSAFVTKVTKPFKRCVFFMIQRHSSLYFSVPLLRNVFAREMACRVLLGCYYESEVSKNPWLLPVNRN